MLRFLIHRVFASVGKAGFYLLLGLAISLFVIVNQGHAAETVILQYRDLRSPISFSDLYAFGAEGELSSDLQQFLQETNQDPANVRQWLTATITPPKTTPYVSSDFVLIQINKTLGEPLGREDLDPLRASVAASLADDQSFSVLELLEHYPEAAVRLELSRLEQVYSDVNLLVTRIEPVLNAATALLPELICDCGLLSIPEASRPVAAIAPSQSSGLLAAFETPPIPAIAPKANPFNAPTPNNAVLLAQEPSNSPAIANKTLVIDFGPFGRSIAMSDLTRFAETGELSQGWRFFFNLANIDPASVQTALNQQVSVDLRFLDTTLNNLLGEFLLYQVGQVVHTPSKTANIQALRAASILSVAEDNQLSLLELLQRYPTSHVHLNALRLSHMGRNLSSVNTDTVRSAAISLEDWLVQLQASTSEQVCTCDAEMIDSMTPPPVAPSFVAAQATPFLPPDWQPVASHREDYGIIRVVWQQGTPYDMGYQHGQLLHDEIASLGTDGLGALRVAGRGLGLGRLAMRRSFPEVVDECQGLTDATQDIGMTMDACMVLAYGDVLQELFGNTLPNMLFWDGCSQWVASGEATEDGRLYHGSTLDNNTQPIDYIMNNPVIFVRQPLEGLPHTFITYPGMIWPNWGVNVAGITVGLDSLHPRSPDEVWLQGSSEVQIMAQVLRTATRFEEARQIMESYPSARANLVMVTDGKSKEAAVFEVIGKHLGIRELQANGVIYTTNHAVHEDVFERQQVPLSESSLRRFERFAQLMEPGGISSLYGTINPQAMAAIGRDRTHPETLEPSPFEIFDDDASPGGNGSLRQGIYDPEKLLIWVAAGPPPVPENPFVCFSLGEMLGWPNATPCESPSL